MNEIFRVADCKGDFLTRAQGEKVRVRLAEAYENLGPDDRLVIDFEGVDVMSPSFADECFGKLAERIGFAVFRQVVSLTGADEVIRTLVNSVLAKRRSAVDESAA